MNNETGKEKGKNDMEVLDRRSKLDTDGLKRTVQNLETQKKMAEGDRDVAKEQIIKLKVAADKEKSTFDKMRTDMQAADKRAGKFDDTARKTQQSLDEALD